MCCGKFDNRKTQAAGIGQRGIDDLSGFFASVLNSNACPIARTRPERERQGKRETARAARVRRPLLRQQIQSPSGNQSSETGRQNQSRDGHQVEKYLKHKDTYKAYTKIKKSKQEDFYNEHTAEIILFDSARKYLKEYLGENKTLAVSK